MELEAIDAFAEPVFWLFTDDLKKMAEKLKRPVKTVNPEVNEKISIFQGDITTLEVGAIVNAAKKSLQGNCHAA